MKQAIILAILIMLAVGVNAACPIKIQAQDTRGLLAEMPSLNTDLQSCPMQLNKNAMRLIGNGQIKVNIVMNDNTIESYFGTISNSQVISLSATGSGYNYLITIDEASLDSLLQSPNKFGTFNYFYANKKITVTASKFFGKIKTFLLSPIARWFAKKNQVQPLNPAQNPQSSSGGAPVAAAHTGKPEKCDDTYLPSHREYAANKELWDSYTADAPDVCQSQYGGGFPSSCVHSVQLSIEGKPYYLCWYNK